MKILAVQVRILYVQGGLRKRVSNRDTLLKSGYLSVVSLSSVKIVADMYKYVAYDNKH